MSFPTQPPYDDPAPTATVAQPYRASTRSRIIVWVIAAILAAPVIAIGANVIYNLVKTAPTADPNAGLVATCRDGVKARLKTPATAQFPKGDQISQLSDTRSKVVGAVDAQNLYGATVRQQYTCEADRDRGGWKVFQIYFQD